MSYLLLSFLVPAVWIDYKYHRIPNVLTGGLLASGVALQVVLYGEAGLVAALGGMLLGFLAFLLPYAKHGLAAGDVKLMAAAGACLGPSDALVAACGSLLVGGGMGMSYVVYYYYSDGTATVRETLARKLPYAPAIAIGSSVALMLKESPWAL